MTIEEALAPDASKPGANIHFALVEVEHHGSWVSKIYTSGIMRRGGVKARPAVTLVDVAKAVRWERDPSELLEDGWIGEEVPRESRHRDNCAAMDD